MLYCKTMENAEAVPGTSADLPPLNSIQQFIVDAAFRACEGPTPAKMPRLDPEDAEADPDDVDRKGRFVQGADLAALLQHFRENLSLPVSVGPLEEEDFFAQYQRSEPESLPVHKAVRKVLEHEWKDIDKSSFPRFLSKRYSLDGLLILFHPW